jgi:hypothetical protein
MLKKTKKAGGHQIGPATLCGPREHGLVSVDWPKRRLTAGTPTCEGSFV